MMRGTGQDSGDTMKGCACRLVIAGLVTGIACSGGSTSPTPTTLHAEVADPVGDAVASPGVLNPPDLVHSTVDVNNGAITFTIQFATGMLTPQSTRLTIELDTDQDASTGNRVTGPLGIDYILDLYAASQTVVSRATPTTCQSGGSCYSQVGTAPLTFGNDVMMATVPLATLGNAGGRMNFRVGAYVFPPPVTPTPLADWMPDINLPPAHVP